MPILDLLKLTDGLSVTWSSCLRDWNGMLRAADHLRSPGTTTSWLARYLADESPNAGDAADDLAR